MTAHHIERCPACGEPSQTTEPHTCPVAAPTPKQRIDAVYAEFNAYPHASNEHHALAEEVVSLRAKLAACERLLLAIEAKEFGGIRCNDVNGVNWFDARAAVATTPQDSVDDDYGPNDGEARTVNRSRPATGTMEGE